MRKWSLNKGMFANKLSLAKGIRLKAGALVQLIACHREACDWTDADFLLIGHGRDTSVKFEGKCISGKCIGKCYLQSAGHFVYVSSLNLIADQQPAIVEIRINKSYRRSLQAVRQKQNKTRRILLDAIVSPGRHVPVFTLVGKYLLFFVDNCSSVSFKSSPPGQNGRHFADDIFKCIFMKYTFWILIRISRTFVPDNTSVLVQVMAWRRTGDKPLSEPMLTQFADAYMRH